MVTHVSERNTGDERSALLAFLEAQRGGIRRALLGLTDEQAATKPSASELSLSGLLKHVVEVEQMWVLHAQGLPPAVPRDESNWNESFRLLEGETVKDQLARWEDVVAETERFIRSVEDLAETFPLPEAPWFAKENVSMRWLMLHLIEEVARHAGHADVIRESLDGKTAYELVAQERGTGA
ncbi:DinB family protein [Streptomyces sp. UNOB3_S3]|uniref:DinB family protein n=1 Tax=Streptomyces sp. UNOB3_S3 TaxID=2871682 RepID=UPI001E64D330|nr:DinB family protein [Streptomyces sp. UNOB3_S3]MCC3777396.1 DinB family protein [Streptomyces sp. UNOB3_S3]